MSKIVLAVNSMISNSEKITSVMDIDGEFFFLYDGKHKWSTLYLRHQKDYRLYYYSSDLDITELAGFGADEWEDFHGMVTYSSSDIGTVEAVQSFSVLFGLVKEIRYGVDKALDEIIDGF